MGDKKSEIILIPTGSNFEDAIEIAKSIQIYIIGGVLLLILFYFMLRKRKITSQTDIQIQKD